MAKLGTRSISRRTVEALKVDKDTVFWDSEQPGFGVRVYPTGAKHYVVQTRARGSAKRLTVGRHGVITPRGGAAACGADHRADQGGRGAGSGAAGGEARGRTDRGRACRAVSQGVRGGALQVEHRDGVPPKSGEAYCAGAGEAAA